MFAKDVIITHDAEKINAIVTEVSETEVKYKKVDNPNGPTFVIATSKIASIMYQNGEVQTFKGAAQPATPQNAQAVQYYNTQQSITCLRMFTYSTQTHTKASLVENKPYHDHQSKNQEGSTVSVKNVLKEARPCSSTIKYTFKQHG